MSIFDLLDRFRGSDYKSIEDLPDHPLDEWEDFFDTELPAAPAECPLCDDEGLCTYHNERTPQYDDQGRCRTCRGTGETIRISHGREGFVECPDCGGRGWV